MKNFYFQMIVCDLISKLEGASDFEWTKGDGSMSESNAKVTKNVLDIQPIESKDIDVYTCVVRSGSLQRNLSVAIDNGFGVHRLHKPSSPVSVKPRIIDIYKYGEQKFNHEYSLKCISGR